MTIVNTSLRAGFRIEADDHKPRSVVGASSGKVERLEETRDKRQTKGEMSEMSLSNALVPVNIVGRRALALLW